MNAAAIARTISDMKQRARVDSERNGTGYSTFGDCFEKPGIECKARINSIGIVRYTWREAGWASTLSKVEEYLRRES